jgi:hypothetical protein
MTIQEQVDKALNNNVDLTDEEMQKEYEKADNITKTHGVKGKASVSESRRLKRITMNYYGTSLNIGASTLAALNNIEKLLYEQNVMLAGIYEKTVGTEERNGE